MQIPRRSCILAVGTAVPEAVLSNQYFEKYLNTTDEWITTRTGIKQRHVIPQGKNIYAYELGLEASKKCIQRAAVSPEDIDAVICATFTPDYFFPSTACKIQYNLGCRKAFAFDISAACAGFVYGLAIADSLIVSGQCRNILLVGTEIISKALNWNDRTTCILFGDGAGAVLISVAKDEGQGVLSTYLTSDGSHGDILKVSAWGENRFIEMDGQEVFKNAVRMMHEGTIKALERAQIKLEQIDLLIPHQANARITKALAEHLGLSAEKVVSNIEKYGNTSSASIPLALEQAWQEQKIRKGALIVFASVGGGLTSGAAVVRF